MYSWTTESIIVLPGQTCSALYPSSWLLSLFVALSSRTHRAKNRFGLAVDLNLGDCENSIYPLSSSMAPRIPRQLSWKTIGSKLPRVSMPRERKLRMRLSRYKMQHWIPSRSKCFLQPEAKHIYGESPFEPAEECVWKAHACVPSFLLCLRSWEV